MPSIELLETIVFPWLLIDSGGAIVHQKIAGLFPIPPNAVSEKSLEHCIRAIPGWSKCPTGFSVFCVRIADQKLVFPGLRILKHTDFHGKQPEKAVWLTQQEFQDYLSRAFLRIGKIEAQTSEIVATNVHDIRRISTDIYNATVKLIERLDAGVVGNVPLEIAKNIDALTDLLRNRINFIDYLSNPLLNDAPRSRIKVYNKFHKLWKSMKPTAEARGLTLRMTGQSESYTQGISNLFDLIPYLMLDNAVKYSPKKETVTISVQENEGKIVCRVTNWGPLLSEDERSMIFLPGFRGSSAVSSGVAGSGAGLATLLRIVKDIHDGELTFTQDDTRIVSGDNDTPYVITHVDAVFGKISS